MMATFPAEDAPRVRAVLAPAREEDEAGREEAADTLARFSAGGVQLADAAE